MLSGACWMFRRAMLDEIGLLNEDLFLYAEEFDICWRAAGRGWQTWFVPTEPVVHLGGKSTSSRVSPNYHRYRSDYLTMRWNRGLGAAMFLALLDQFALRWRALKARLVASNDPEKREMLRTAVSLSGDALREMVRWRPER